MAHTPGPWTTGSHGYDNVKGFNSNTARKFRRVRHGDVEVARVWCGTTDDDDGRIDSSPHDLMLILAAPELLEACQAVAADLEQLLDGDDFSGMSDDELFAGFLRVLRPAINKAGGKAE
jgi:hypothetical protein